MRTEHYTIGALSEYIIFNWQRRLVFLTMFRLMKGWLGGEGWKGEEETDIMSSISRTNKVTG